MLHQAITSESLKQLDISQLIDLLSLHTEKYMTLHRNGKFDGEYDLCKAQVKQIQYEVESRRAGGRVIED